MASFATLFKNLFKQVFSEYIKEEERIEKFFAKKINGFSEKEIDKLEAKIMCQYLKYSRESYKKNKFGEQDNIFTFINQYLIDYDKMIKEDGKITSDEQLEYNKLEIATQELLGQLEEVTSNEIYI